MNRLPQKGSLFFYLVTQEKLKYGNIVSPNQSLRLFKSCKLCRIKFQAMILKNASVLVIDDDTDVLTAVKLLLKTEVKEVTTEKNPENIRSCWLQKNSTSCCST